MSWCGLGQRATIYLRWALGVLFLTLVAVLFGLSVYDGTIFFTLWLWFMSTVVLQARSQPFPVPLRVLVSVLILLGAGFVTLIPWILFGGRATCQARRGPSITVWGQGFEEHWLDMQLRLSCTWVMILIAIYITLGDHPPSTHIRQISRCIYFLCFGKLIQVIPSMVDSCHVPNLNAEGYRLETSPDAVVAKVSSVFGLATSYVGVIWFMQLVVQRLLALEEAFGKRLPYSRASFWLSRALTPWVVLQGFALYFSRVLVLLIAISLTIGIKVLAMLLCIAYQRPLQFLHRALKMADDDDGLAQEMRKETRFAMKLIRKSQIAIFLGTTGMAFCFISFGLESMLQDKNWSLVYVVASSLDALSIVGGLAMLSGVSVFKRSPQLTSRRSSLTSRRQDCDSSCSCEKQQNRPCEQCRWQAKVAELAGRRVTVEELLDFYLQLGGDEAMPHFDPETSTTNDVVRQMVIPSTLKEDGFGYSYAELCDDRTNAKLLTASGTPRTARRTSRSSKTGQCPRMVTHHWSNRFRDLLAAVLADALNLKRWDKLAERLMARKGEELKEQLYGQGSLHQEYWICAFCINQHASICSNAFGAKDTATGQALPCCGCRTPKVLNDQPIDCEMNKFDNMMAYLHQEFDGFLQVVAIDNDFQIFSRAWCVAELVQADASHLEQHMVIHSPDALEANKWQLNHIRVEDCQASRPEDKQTILAKIGSPEEVQKFNEHLHLILLGNGGLLACWMDGQRLLQEIGAISARAKARVERQSRVQAIPPAALGASSVAGDEEKSGEVLPTFML